MKRNYGFSHIRRPAFSVCLASIAPISDPLIWKVVIALASGDLAQCAMDNRFQIGLSFALISTATLVIDYFLQVSVIQPSLSLGESDGIALLSQFNGHGVFIVLEEIGFFMMSLSMLCMAPVFAGKTRSERAIRWLFVVDFALTVISSILCSAFYGIFREYRFEVATISINWLALIASGIPLSLVFKRALVEASGQRNTSLAKQRAKA